MRYAILILAAAAASAQHSSTTITNPYNTAKDRVEGAATYRSQCGACHGPDAKGGSGGPDLSRGQYKHAVSEEAMFKVITKGVPGTSMPGYSFDGKLAWQLVAYLRGLNQEQGGGVGDAGRGASLFASLRCAGCHSGKAPNLADASQRMTRAELRLALVDPNASVSAEYWQWKWKLRDGATVSGRRLNEDTYSIQVMLANGRLQTLLKHDVAASEDARKSPMPSFAGKVPDGDIDSLVAYLVSLRRAN
ncbi:MAG: c-type cytochrome [Acidobacteria bacterium]|nr:c-type cytochrome [Acidobacteriota bacterium]